MPESNELVVTGPDTEKLLLQEFRDDLQAPMIEFGRCAVTGEFGKVAVIDLGALSFEHPDVDKGVDYDTKTKKVTFNNWKPIIHQSHVCLSESGLRRVLEWMGNQANPVPSHTPDLVYQWLVRYTDGSILSQFRMGENEEEEEVRSSLIEFDRVAQCEVIPRELGDTSLPKFALDLRSGNFFRDGQCINEEIDYPGTFDPEVHTLAYGRKVMATFGSHLKPGRMSRTIHIASSSVHQILGWSEGGKAGLHNDARLPCSIISIDDNGLWRPYKQVK